MLQDKTNFRLSKIQSLPSPGSSKTYPLFASFITIPDAPKAINSNGFSVFPGKSRWVLGMVLAKFGNESTKLVEDELN
jgi:hypothetical protein